MYIFDLPKHCVEVQPEQRTVLNEVLVAFGFLPGSCSITPVEEKPTHHTFRVHTDSNEFILQRIDKTIFRQPEDIASNISLIKEYLDVTQPEYRLTVPLRTKNDHPYCITADHEYYRIIPLVEGSHKVLQARSSAQAYEAAKQFGRFARMLAPMNAHALKTTIPYIHNISYRYRMLLDAFTTGDRQRIRDSKAVIEEVLTHHKLMRPYEAMGRDPQFRHRVMHNDTRIANVLFDDNGKGLQVIGIDTVMPNYFLGDLGDLFRTCVSASDEEAQETREIVLRPEFFQAICSGYLEEMGDELTEKEKQSMFYSGTYMMLLYAMQFLTDHLQSDRYRPVTFVNQNLSRAINQAALLREWLRQERAFSKLSF